MTNEANSYGSGATIEKLDAMYRYADEFTKALKNKPAPDNRFVLHYVDAFAGRGEEILKAGVDAGRKTRGSALRALDVTDRPFDRFLFIEKIEHRFEVLKRIVADESGSERVTTILGDANQELPTFCNWLGSREGKMHRAFVFVDPYAMQVDWRTIEAIAETKRADMLMLFPLMALRRNLKRDGWPTAEHQAALNRFFGDESWISLYSPSKDSAVREGGDREIVAAYSERMSTIFAAVVDPQRTLGSADDGSLFTMVFGASNPDAADLAERIAKGVFKAAMGVQRRMRI